MRELWRALTRPVAPPPGWVRSAGLIASATAVGIVATIVWGHAWYGNPNKVFGEAAPGTILSVALLAGAGAVAARVIEDSLKIAGGALILIAFVAAYLEAEPPALAGRESRRAS